MAKPCTDYSVLRSFKYARHTRKSPCIEVATYMHTYIHIYIFHRCLRLSPDNRIWNMSKTYKIIQDIQNDYTVRIYTVISVSNTYNLYMQKIRPQTKRSVYIKKKNFRATLNCGFSFLRLPQYLLLLENTVNHSQDIWQGSTVIHNAV